MPHISLLYGNHSIEIRNEVARQVKLQEQSFKLKSLVVTPSVHDPRQWKHLHEIEL